MRELLEQGWGSGVIIGIAGIGVFVRLLLAGYYGSLGRACKHFETTGNKTIAYIREDLKKRSERKHEIKNALTYTEYRLTERRICGFRIGSLEGMVAYSLLLTGVSCILLFMCGIFMECGEMVTLNLLLFGGISIGCLIVLDVLTGLREKKKRVRLRLKDYIENSWSICEDSEVGDEDDIEKKEVCSKKSGGTERKEARERERQRKKEERLKKREIRKNKGADKPKSAGKKHGKAQEEKRRLTEELLRERRQLEAKSLAEQRRKEREETVADVLPKKEEQVAGIVTEEVEEQVREEVAVTESPAETAVSQTPEYQKPIPAEDDTRTKCELSYEALLNEFLKEYPA